MIQELWRPELPEHCIPVNDFLLRFSSTFHVCVPTNLAFISNTLGLLSIVAWLSAQLPQIWKNYSLKSTSGLSIYFLVEWCLGDLGNLLGALFTHQAPWQVMIGAYYVFVDFCLVLQWIWYERLKHGRHVFKIRATGQKRQQGGADMDEVIVEGVSPQTQQRAERRTQPRPIFRTPTFEAREEEKSSQSTPRGTKIYRVGPSTPFPAPSPRTVLMLACFLAVARASPLTGPLVQSMHTEQVPSKSGLEIAGSVLSWLSTVLYLASRLPQIYKNWARQSTAGLSAHLFVAAFLGNLFYSAAIATNPNAWSDFGPYGGGGWAGAQGSSRDDWIAAALPFFLGAAGVLGLDATVGIQFIIYGEKESRVIVIDEERGPSWKWRRVSGWMRGWVPTVNDSKGTEGRRLLEHSDTHGEGYGTLT